MTKFDMHFSDAEREEAERAKVTPIKCGMPTQEEMEEAYEEMLNDWRNQ